MGRGRGNKSSGFTVQHPEGSVSFSTEQICRDEIEGAVHLLAYHNNVVAVHLLASSAHDVMRDYAKSFDKPIRADVFAQVIAAAGESADATRIALRKPYNSLKHGINSGNAAVTFHPGFAEITLNQACFEFSSLFGYMTPKMLMAVAWVFVVYPPFREALGDPEILETFSSALTDGPRIEQLSSLRERLEYIDNNPDEFADYRQELSATEHWERD